MSKNSDGVKKWRNKTKELIVEAMGGCCQICGYSKCVNALDLHHIDPSKKELSFGSIRANPKSIDRISVELKKCILLCSNCHREIHANVTSIPDNYIIFDESFINKSKEDIKERKSLAIKKMLSKGNYKKILLSNEEVYNIYVNNYNKNAVKTAEYFNVSEAAIRKRIKKHLGF